MMINGCKQARRRLGASLLGACMIVGAAGLAQAETALPLHLQAHLGPHLAPAVPGDADLGALGRFYAQRAWQPVWSGSEAAERRAHLLAVRLLGAVRDGLAPEDYGAERVAGLLHQEGEQAKAELELASSRALLRYARDLGHGRLAVQGGEFDVPTDGRFLDAVAVLEAAAGAGDFVAFLDGLAPASPAYRRLQGELARLRSIEAQGGWGHFEAKGALRPGMTDAAVPGLRARLEAGGDLPRGSAPPEAAPRTPGGADPLRYDAALEAALRRFQIRHGLEPDGVVGAMTLKALNQSVAWRIDQVLVNLERLRHHSRDLGDRYLLVNIPAYHLEYVDRGRGVQPVAFESRVVVGTIRDQTPTFTGLMTYLELNPNWDVPRSIAVNEILPELRKDPGYLARNGYVLLADGAAVDPWGVDWSGIDRRSFPYRIRQLPGSANALGQVKFMFPNRHAVYIHDTPSKGLFARTERAYSHGCIRLSDPFALAELLLGQQGWDGARIDQAVATGRNRVVRLDEPVPVHLTYRTAWVAEDGTAHFREDIYGRDAERARELEAPSS
jgi:L,D-transpeptidase YcbB